jgi:uncharacterized membrane protein (DUF4010 family)
MDIQDLLSRFAVALGVGLLIGLERGWRSREDAPGSRTAGIRTFALSGLLGGIVGALAVGAGGVTAGGGVIVGAGFAAYAVVFGWFCHMENQADGTFSVTTAVVGMVTFALGTYALMGDMRAAAAAGVVTAGLLAGRENLHGWVARITWPELRSGLVLLAMTFVALPFMPSQEIDALGGVNLREIWLIAIVLAGVSFLGYVAVKYIGAEHGILLSAAAGGLVSSTAVTLANARRAAEGEGSPRLLAAGVSLATAISLVRVIAIVGALKPVLLILIAPPLVAGVAVTAGAALFSAYWRADGKRSDSAITFRNPFSLLSVVGFAALLGAVIAVGKLLGEHTGMTGAILGAVAMGLADVDAVSVAMARLAPHTLSIAGASFAILAAVASNTLSKLVMAVAIGRGRFARELVIVFAAATVAAAAGLWLGLLFSGEQATGR